MSKFTENYDKGKEYKPTAKTTKKTDGVETRKCYHCHKGHLKKDYPTWKKRKDNNQKNRIGTSSEYAYGDNNCADVLSITKKSSSDRWIFDSGCTFHMCHPKSWFMDLKAKNRGSPVGK